MSCIINILEKKKKKEKKKKDANSEVVTYLRREIYVKLFSSLNPLKVFTKNCKTYRNIAKQNFLFLSNSLITFSITLMTFAIVFYCLEQLLTVILKNN